MRGMLRGWGWRCSCCAGCVPGTPSSWARGWRRRCEAAGNHFVDEIVDSVQLHVRAGSSGFLRCS
eukprot:12448080-Prorocentrum_lima.AAC.1